MTRLARGPAMVMLRAVPMLLWLISITCANVMVLIGMVLISMVLMRANGIVPARVMRVFSRRRVMMARGRVVMARGRVSLTPSPLRAFVVCLVRPTLLVPV